MKFSFTEEGFLIEWNVISLADFWPVEIYLEFVKN